MHTVRKFIHVRPGLMFSIVLGILVGSILFSSLSWVTRLLIGWNVMTWVYLFCMAWLMIHASHARVRKIAEDQDHGAVIVLVMMSVAAVISLVAIVLELAGVHQLTVEYKLLYYLLTGFTVLGSWLMVGVLFTFHYALFFYKSLPTQRALVFPNQEQNPNYWDFLYFSFTIAVAAQTSDVMVMNRAMRKTVLAQSVLSFLFNAAILGFMVNIAASMFR
jgi:uncharacterized membrane protein